MTRRRMHTKHWNSWLNVRCDCDLAKAISIAFLLSSDRASAAEMKLCGRRAPWLESDLVLMLRSCANHSTDHGCANVNVT